MVLVLLLLPNRPRLDYRVSGLVFNGYVNVALFLIVLIPRQKRLVEVGWLGVAGRTKQNETNDFDDLQIVGES